MNDFEKETITPTVVNEARSLHEESLNLIENIKEITYKANFESLYNFKEDLKKVIKTYNSNSAKIN